MSIKLIAETLKDDNKNAILALQNGDYDTALSYFARSRDIEQKLNLDVNMARTDVNISNIFYLKNKIGEAHAVLSEALELFEKNSKTEEYDKAKYLQAQFYVKEQKFHDAEVNIRNILMKNTEQSLKADAYVLLFSLVSKKEPTYKVLDYLKKASDIFLKLKDKKKLAYCIELKAKYYESINRKDLAFIERSRLSQSSL